MAQHLFWTIGSVLVTSAVALAGIVTMVLGKRRIHGILPYLVGFAAGGMFGGAFIHLLPKTATTYGFTPTTGVLVLAGIVTAFAIENYIHWHHHHGDHAHEPFTYMIVLGDGVHNLIDGMVIAGSYLASIPTGIAATIAVVVHELPQEIGDFGVLVHGGLSTRKALGFNLLSALASLLGAGVVLLLAGSVGGINRFILPLSAGSFIYIAGADLIPEIKEEEDMETSTLLLASFILGIAVMYAVRVINTG